MSGFAVSVSGTDELAAACDAVAAVLTSPETATDAAALVADAARPRVPRDTGHLASTESITPTGSGAALEWLATYALPVHTRTPWLPAAIAAAEAPITDLYADRAALAWS